MLRYPHLLCLAADMLPCMSADTPLFESEPEELPPQGAEEQPPLAPADVPPAERERPTPHLAKLKELLKNNKLPRPDLPRAEVALAAYTKWIEGMLNASGEGDEKVRVLVQLLNEYKRAIELDLIWDSEQDFLYRQRGQVKLDNSIIEEFLPWLVDPAILPELSAVECYAGPRKAFAAASFGSTLLIPGKGAGLRIRTKNQDFTISRPAYLRSSFDRGFPPDQTVTSEVHLAYLAAECKTNLDKTMFQEASATAHDLKVALPGARYYLVCEFLDMTPISTASTDIDEALILRGQRMGAQERQEYSNAAVRRERREEYVRFLDERPVHEHVVLRIVEHLRALFVKVDLDEDEVLAKGYF
jgi:hypothetical protein